MKTLSGALSAALGAAVQRPALLVQIGFGTVQRWTSASTMTWAGQTWSARDMRIDGLRVQALQVSGSLILGNADDVAGTLILAEGIQDKAITVWGYDAAATASGDVVWLATAVGASAQVDARAVRIALRHRCEFVASPRARVTPAAGFGHLLPAGTVLRINGQDLRLERN